MGRMTAFAEWRLAVADLRPGASATFHLRCGAKALDGFIVHHEGDYYAYVNRCPHVGTPLDLWPNEFFTEDGRALICSTHGAVFEAASGRCTMGPCAGDTLTPLPVRREGDVVVVACPPPRS